MEQDFYRDTPLVPEDAGEYADELLEVLNRIPVGWGRWISCGKGWYPLIVETNKKMRLLVPEYEIHQIKEKFGELRFYWGVPAPENSEEISEEQEEHNNFLHEIMHDIEANAERRSRMICELCGERGSTRSQDYWYKTLCTNCAIEHNYPLEEWEEKSMTESSKSTTQEDVEVSVSLPVSEWRYIIEVLNDDLTYHYGLITKEGETVAKRIIHHIEENVDI